MEEQLDKLQSQLADVEETLGDPELYEGGAKDRLKQLLDQQAALKREVSATEESWMETLEELEQLEAELSQG